MYNPLEDGLDETYLEGLADLWLDSDWVLWLGGKYFSEQPNFYASWYTALFVYHHFHHTHH